MFTKCYLNSEYIHSRLINLDQKVLGRNYITRPSTLAVTGANVPVAPVESAPLAVTTLQLHWLPVHQRMVFKITGLVHQSLVGVAPAYLADDCGFLSDAAHCSLWSNSNDTRMLLMPCTHNKLGDRSFSAAGPRLWNDLPPWTTAAGTVLRLLQTISEILRIWQPKRLVTLSNL